MIPTTIDGLGGGSVSTVVNGFTHDLFPLGASVSASSVRLQITGTGLEVYAVMLLKLGLRLNTLRHNLRKWTGRVFYNNRLTVLWSAKEQSAVQVGRRVQLCLYR